MIDPVSTQASSVLNVNVNNTLHVNIMIHKLTLVLVFIVTD